MSVEEVKSSYRCRDQETGWREWRNNFSFLRPFKKFLKLDNFNAQ
ncbi:hypothetical protein, unlikely [Trypanosoma brucei brucei TREU927]|uniref:Uncharacterized protein n=1 Tax=Trypanosoma brucei brucei (strain 927/4 GUTat10.1) TaxID=185431 RepID=Q4GY73_TRYB2|nr:hypothetical protein, unlikely [Trypanosoma brucei brucei TREU927]CAJ16713.1 hypothetical protein, unlikely [Trypanosoma brucei brucei TREU927]